MSIVISARRASQVASFMIAFTLSFYPSSSAFAISDGCDLEFGGPGNAPGLFTSIKDFAFDRAGNLYVLDGPVFDRAAKKYVGSRRVQKFDNEGRYLSERSLADDAVGSAALGEKNLPQKLVVTADGDVVVTQPDANRLWIVRAERNGFSSIPVDGAAAIAVPHYGKAGPIYVIDSRRGKGREWLGGERIEAVKADGSPGISIALEKKLDNVVDMAIAPNGNFIILADVNQLYVFSPTGKLLRVAGAGSSTRNEDGSEPLHTVACDAAGNIYTMTWGNPGLVTKYDADFTTVLQRDGQFKWADPWSTHSSFVPLAIDPNGRLWAAAPEPRDPKNVNFSRYRPTPALIRTKTDFLKPGGKGVTQRSALLLGFKPAIKASLPYNVAYDLNPIELSFVVGAAGRQIEKVDVAYRVQDHLGHVVDRGELALKLEQGREAAAPFSFQPPKFGWYTVTADCSVGGKKLLSIGEHLGVTPPYPQMKSRLAAGEANGSWDDAPRQMFCGLTNMRLHPKLDQPGKTDNLDTLENDAIEAIKLGATVILQFSEKKDCTPENIRRYVERLKGRMKYWEVMNEPNFSMSAEEYAKLLAESYAVIKAADPEAQVLGPSHCGISLPWIESFLKAGGGKHLDIVSIHDYEGHESIDATHWRWKYAALRELLKKYEIGDKPVWQTERAISASRGGNFTGLAQAVRTTLHRNLLESLGVAPQHNNHYYLNEGGYNTVPSYVWSRNGPYPAALALRTRHALTEANGMTFRSHSELWKDRMIESLLDFSYWKGDSRTIVLQTLGIPSLPLEVSVEASDKLEMVDAFGNVEYRPVVDGKVLIEATQLPIYVVTNAKQKVHWKRFDFTRNFALRAELSYSATSSNGLELINNGIVETYNAGHPHGGTDGKKIWQGDWPSEGVPTLTFEFPLPRKIDTVFIHGVQADNNFCALLDYDIEAEVAGKWRKVAGQRAQLPPSDLVVHGQNNGNNWYDGRYQFLHRFELVEALRLRVIVHRTTQGFAADEAATAILKQTWGGKGMPMKVMIREVELCGPQSPIHVQAEKSQLRPHANDAQKWFATMSYSVVNNTKEPVQRRVTFELPAGWRRYDDKIVELEPDQTQGSSITMLDVARQFDVGRHPVDFKLIGPDGVEDVDSAFVTVESPVRVQPQSPAMLDDKRQQLTAAVTNVGNRPLAGTLDLHITGPKPVDRVTGEFGPIAAGQSATVSFVVPNIDLARGPWTATYTAVANRIRSRTEQPLNVRLWSIIGPFEKDFEKAFGPEQSLAAGVDLKRTHFDGFGNEQKWRVAASEPNGMLNMTKHIVPKDNVCAYAVVYVESPTAQQAIFATGTDDGGKIWLNGNLIVNDDSSHPASPGGTLVPVELKGGRNEVVFKIMQGNGGWGCYLDFLDVKTRLPIAGLIYRPTP